MSASKKKVDKVQSWSSLLNAMAMKKDVNGKTYREAIIRQLLKKAKDGQQWAVQEVLNRMDGKPIQRTQNDITTGGESLNATVQFIDSKVTTQPVVDAECKETVQ